MYVRIVCTHTRTHTHFVDSMTQRIVGQFVAARRHNVAFQFHKRFASGAIHRFHLFKVVFVYFYNGKSQISFHGIR